LKIPNFKFQIPRVLTTGLPINRDRFSKERGQDRAVYIVFFISHTIACSRLSPLLRRGGGG
jgi:hypothetical protein